MGDVAKLVHRFWDAVESKDWDHLDGLFADDIVFEFPGMHLDGPVAVKEMCKGWLTAFPDMRHETLEEFESDGNYACRLHITGTHNGPFVTPAGEIPATGRSIEFVSADYITGTGGKIGRWFAYPDMAGLIAQIS